MSIVQYHEKIRHLEKGSTYLLNVFKKNEPDINTIVTNVPEWKHFIVCLAPVGGRPLYMWVQQTWMLLQSFWMTRATFLATSWVWPTGLVKACCCFCLVPPRSPFDTHYTTYAQNLEQTNTIETRLGKVGQNRNLQWSNLWFELKRHCLITKKILLS